MVLTVNGVTVQLNRGHVIIHDRLYEMGMPRKEAIIKYLMDEGFIPKGRQRYYTKNRL